MHLVQTRHTIYTGQVLRVRTWCVTVESRPLLRVHLRNGAPAAVLAAGCQSRSVRWPACSAQRVTESKGVQVAAMLGCRMTTKAVVVAIVRLLPVH
jgi:hypothetical protein